MENNESDPDAAGSPGEDEGSDGEIEDMLPKSDPDLGRLKSVVDMKMDHDDLGSGGSGNNGPGDVDSNSGSPNSRDNQHTPTESDSLPEPDILARLRQQVHGLMKYTLLQEREEREDMENEIRRAQREAVHALQRQGQHTTFQQNPNFLAALAAASAAGLRSPPTLVPPATSLPYTSISIPPSPIPSHGPYSMTSPSPGSQGGAGNADNTNQQTWSFEEQFKQLYELSDDPKRKEFLDDLFNLMQNLGTPITRLPIMAKGVLDLFQLYKLVIERGGLVEVIQKKLWQEICKELNIPSSCTSAAFSLRRQYMKYLYQYECHRVKLSTPEELQAAIDGNRRETKRPSYPGPYGDPLGRGGQNLGSSLGPPMSPFVHTNRPTMNGNASPHPLGGCNFAGVSPSTNPTPAALLNMHQRLKLWSTMVEQAANAGQNVPTTVGDLLPSPTSGFPPPQRGGLSPSHLQTPTALRPPGSVPPPQGEPLNLASTDTPMANIKRNGNHEDIGLKRRPSDRERDRERGRDRERDGSPPPKRIAQDTDLGGLPATHIKIESRGDGRGGIDNASLVVSLEINGIMYQGVLFAQAAGRSRLS